MLFNRRLVYNKKIQYHQQVKNNLKHTDTHTHTYTESKLILSDPLLFSFSSSHTELLTHFLQLKSLDVGKVPFYP